MKTKLLTLLLALTLLFFFVNYFDEDLQEGLDAIKREDYKTAYNFFLPLAAQGDSNGQYFLGLMYYEGREVQQNDKEATKWFRLAAEQGHFEAQLTLGLMYYEGNGVPQDYKQAFKLFKLTLAEEEYSGVIDSFGRNYGISQRAFFSERVPHHKMPYHNNNLIQRSENALGEIYEQGQVVQRNYEEAAKWYRRAVEKIFYEDVCRWMDCRNHSRYPTALYNLGRMYDEGLGLPEDNVMAFVLFNDADYLSGNVMEDAKHRMDIIVNKMTSIKLREASEKTKFVVEQYFENVNYGKKILERRIYLQKHKTSPREDSEKEKVDDVQGALNAFRKGDYKTAYKLFLRSGEQGDAVAQNNLGYMNREGLGVPKNYVLAHMWWNLSSKKGYEQATEYLGYLEKPSSMTPSQIEKAQEMARNWKPKR